MAFGGLRLAGENPVADRSITARLLALALVVGPSAAGAQPMSSANYSIPKLVQNQGSGFRLSETYQITSDVISDQPVEASTSANYQLFGRPLVTSDSTAPSCGVYINNDVAVTSSVNVTLGLACGHSTGCAEVQLSNNGVDWTPAAPYSLSKPWTLVANDSTRKVFARFKSGSGVWSGACWDSVVLDTTAPRTSLSPTGGTYMNPVSVAVTASEPSTIKYTADGSDPTTSPTALVYSGPIPLTDDTTLKAFSTDAVGYASPVVSETYEVCTGNGLSISGFVLDATRANAPMPLVRITLSNGQTVDTSPTGAYSFAGLPRGYYTITSATAPVTGYVTYQSTFKLCKASITHDIILTKDGTTYGKDTNSGYSADGVNTSTGNFTYRVSDLALPGPGPSVAFDRTYNSQDGANGPLGYGWTWNYNISLFEDLEGVVVVRWGDGKTEVWKPDGAGGYTPMYGVFSTLIKNPGNTFTLRRKDLIDYSFDASDRLASIVDEYGNQIAFNYSGQNLASIVDTAGRVISLSYDASNRIVNVFDPIGRSASFTYDANGDLASSTNLAGKVTLYTYDALHQMLTMTDPMGNVTLTNQYDSGRGVVVSQRDALGGETNYVYDVPNRVTTIIDAEGNTARHHFDNLLRLTQEEDGNGNSSFRTYNARGTVDTATDKRGKQTTFEYDAKGNVLFKREPMSRVTAATYDANSNPLSKTDARGNSTVFEYDPGNGNLIAKYACGAVPVASCAGDASVAKTAYTYDPLTGQLLTVTAAAGAPALERTTTSQYDIVGNRVAVIDALGNTSTFTFDEVGRKLTENHPLGRATAYEYDAMDRLLSVTDALGGESGFVYDDNGNKTSHRDAAANVTTFSYDAKDRLLVKMDALGGTERYSYDALNRRTAVTNARDAVSTITYDAVGNVVLEIDALGNLVRHEYDPNGNRTATVDARGGRTTFVYDDLNRLIETTDPLGNTQETEYDLNGNKTRVIDAQGKITRFTYDAFNQLIEVTDPVGNTTTNTYDLLGRLVRVRDARGNETAFEYEALDRLTRVTDAAGGIVTAAYDALGNRTSVVDPRGKQTTYVYDVLNRLVSESDPLGNSAAKTYDQVGNLLTLSNADGTTTYAYDDLYRITEITQPNLTTSTYSYDARGNRLSVVDIAGTTTSTYDMVDRLASVTDPFGNTVGYTYDPNGNRNGLIYPGNRRVTYLFDALDRMVSVQDWGGVTTTYTYDTAGRLASQLMGNGSTVTYSYDDSGRLLAKEDKNSSGEVIASYTYTLDPNGNRTGMGMNQPLLPEAPPDNATFTHNDGNQVTSRNGTTYTYDGKGNRATKTEGGVTTQYTYDFNNRLTRVNDGANLWEYLYNSDGKRLSSSANGVATRYLLDLNGSMESVLAEIPSVGAAARYYVYGDGLLYNVDGATGERHFYHYDPIGSTVALTSLGGEVSDGYAYLPFGEAARSEGTHDTPFTFVGKFGVTREGNGLYFMRARFYDPQIGSFLGKDPIEATLADSQASNPYQYAGNNPMLAIDPKGEALVVLGQSHLKVNFGKTGLGRFARSPLGRSLIKEAIKQGSEEVVKDQLKKQGFWDWVNEVMGGPGFANGPTAMVIVGPTTGRSEEVEGTDGVQVPLLQDTQGLASSAPGEAVLSGDPSQAQASTRNWTTYRPSSTASEQPLESKPVVERKPRQYLSVAGYAKAQFGKEYRHILAPDFLDNETRSIVELSIESEIHRLQTTRRYGYSGTGSKKRVTERRNADVAGAVGGLYTRLTAALSKHEIMIRDLSALPQGATGGPATSGIYGGGR